MTSRPKTVDEYIAAAPEEAQEKLREVRKCLLSAAPKAEESLKWGTPAVSYHRILITYAAYKNHLSFYPTPSVMRGFTKELADYETSEAGVKFPYDEPLPLDLIRKMTEQRVKESVEEDKRWM